MKNVDRLRRNVAKTSWYIFHIRFFAVSLGLPFLLRVRVSLLSFSLYLASNRHQDFHILFGSCCCRFFVCSHISRENCEMSLLLITTHHFGVFFHAFYVSKEKHTHTHTHKHERQMNPGGVTVTVCSLLAHSTPAIYSRYAVITNAIGIENVYIE